MKHRHFLFAFVLVLVLLAALPAFAAPFLVCDPQDGVTRYDVEIDGAIVNVPAEADGSLRYDCAKLSRGPVYTFRARGANVWEVSDWCAPLESDSRIPASPNLKLVSE